MIHHPVCSEPITHRAKGFVISYLHRWMLCGKSTKLSPQVKTIRTLHMLLICISSAYLIQSVFSIWQILSCAELPSNLWWPGAPQSLQLYYCQAGFLNFFLSWKSCSSRYFLSILVSPQGLRYLKWVGPWNVIKQCYWEKKNVLDITRRAQRGGSNGRRQTFSSKHLLKVRINLINLVPIWIYSTSCKTLLLRSGVTE